MTHTQNRKKQHSGVNIDPYSVISDEASIQINKNNTPNEYCNTTITGLALNFYYYALRKTMTERNIHIGGMDEIDLRRTLPQEAESLVKQAMEHYAKHILPPKIIIKKAWYCRFVFWFFRRISTLLDNLFATFITFIIVTYYAPDAIDGIIDILKNLRVHIAKQ